MAERESLVYAHQLVNEQKRERRARADKIWRMYEVAGMRYTCGISIRIGVVPRRRGGTLPSHLRLYIYTERIGGEKESRGILSIR